ncbi:MAG: AAA family ATPase, partial [Actinomycetota bacterium]
PAAALETLGGDDAVERRVGTGFPSVDRVLGGGVVPGSVALLAGEPGIGKSTLLLQLVSTLSAAGLPCLLASGEESRAQVAARARRLGIDGDALAFTAGRELGPLLAAARDARPFLLAVDSIQTLRDPDAGQVPGGPSQVRACADALVGLAKAEGIAVLVTGHVTKDGDLAGPRTLEHAVDVVLSFEGEPRSGLRMLTGGKNRFGTEGEVAWFEMTARGLTEIDPSALLAPGSTEAGCAIALPRLGRRSLAVEVQALVAPTDGSARRQASGLDARRFQLVAAVLDRAGIPVGRADLFGATAGGVRVDDPACDLAIAAALASAATGVPAPRAAFVGELSLTGVVRPVAGMEQRIAAANAVGIDSVHAPIERDRPAGGVLPVRHLRDALAWAFPGARRTSRGPVAAAGKGL